MNSDDWELEMKRMLESFARQAEYSLREINRCFETMGRPFDDDFRKYYLEVSNQRLDISFKTVLFSKGPVRGNETDSSCTNHRSAANEQSLNSLKTESVGDLIEIYDSDDDEQQLRTQANTVTGGSHIEVNKDTDSPVKQDIPNNIRDGTQSDSADVGSENEDKPFAKVESCADIVMEMVNIPFIQFNPREENGATVAASGRSKIGKEQRTVPSANRNRNQTKRDKGKRFKCEHCDCVFKTKQKFEQHQSIHANGKLIGVKADSNGLYHCTLCVRRFTILNNLSMHLKSHKNSQRLFHCARCMRQFVQKAKKERHERQCKGRHYECHLCKVYVTRKRDDMQRHMRTHSGAKPFQCMVCNEYFQERSKLRHHMNRAHTRNKP